MKKIRENFIALAFASMAWLLGACAPNAPYHTTGGEPRNCVETPDDPSCRESYYQEYAGYDLAIAEFSERGNVFDNRYVDEVLQRIADKAQDEGVVLVVFIHGWKHNAKEDDPNLIDFKKSLGAVADVLKEKYAKGDLAKRRLVGMYIGWRGASIELPGLIETTFWDRKAVAEEVGKGGVTSLLLELDKITKPNARNVMVVIGHSFGGAIVVSALSEVLTERALNRPEDGGTMRTLGDQVIVINPAVEANQALNFLEAALGADYTNNQQPLFISLSSDADWPTHYAFPLGQTVGLLATWRQADLHRDYYADRDQPDKPLALREEHLDSTTVGNFAPFLTHRLTVTDKGEFKLETCEQNPQGCEPAGLTSLSGRPTIRPLPANYPLSFIKTDASLMTGHNDIFNDKVRSFIVTLVDKVVARNFARMQGEPKAVPALSLSSSPAAIEQFQDSVTAMYRQLKARQASRE